MIVHYSKLCMNIMIVFSTITLLGCDMILKQYSPAEPLPVEIKNTGKINILVPSFAESWQQGSEVLIRWQTHGDIKQVNIFLFRKSEMIYNITTYSDNKNNYRWQIPVNLPNSVQYSIRIENSYNKDEFAVSERFSIKQ